MLAFRYYNYLRQYLSKQYPKFFKFISKFKNVIKYLIAGGTAAIVNLFFLMLFYKILELSIVISTSLAFLLAFLISFSLQKFWTFRNFSKRRLPRQVFTYFLLAFFSLILNARWMYLLVEILAMWYILAQIIIGSVLAILNFFAYKFLVFKPKK